MKKISIAQYAGEFAENKDIAQSLRVSHIAPALAGGEEVVLDFVGVESATQSFVHALISQLMRDDGASILEKIAFQNCNDIVKKIISIVVEYMQESDPT